jgi:DNA-directed RNA polymerase specialized sigma24 family protein
VGLTNPNLAQGVEALVAWAKEQETEVARASAAAWAMTVLAEATAQLSTVRIEAVRALWAMGWSLTDISEALSISRARVHQIIEK